MSASQMAAFQTNIYQHKSVSSMFSVAPLRACPLPARSLKLTRHSSAFLGSKVLRFSQKPSVAASKYLQHSPVCLFGGKGNSGSGNESSPWKELENAAGNFKKDQSIEDLLRQQMKKQEYFDGGGSGGSPPDDPRGGGGGGYPDEPEDTGILDELLQVILATAGFVFLVTSYVYINETEEITTLAKDFIKFVFTGQKSIRLRRTFERWVSFFQRLTRKDEGDPFWLEREILSTPTWWDSPSKHIYFLRRQVASRSY